MNKQTLTLIFTIAVGCFACRKTEITERDNQFVKPIISDVAMASVACFSDKNNNFIVFARSNTNATPGMIVNLNQFGEEQWRKPIPQSNRLLWTAFQFKSGEYLTCGYDEITINRFNIVKYSADGTVLLQDTISLPSACNGCSPPDIIELNNGNLIFSFGAAGPGRGYILTVSSLLKLIETKIYNTPNSNYSALYFKGLQQVNDSTLAISGSCSRRIGYSKAFTNLYFITTDLSGTLRTQSFLIDSVQSETPNVIGVNRNGIFVVTSTMLGWNSGQGVYVNYLNSSIAEYISGRINILEFDLNGKFKKRTKIYSYPNNGVIHSVKPTSDGGFILCGTVNQNNTITVDGNTQMYLLKLDANFKEEWSKVVYSSYPAFTADVMETFDGGYFVCGHQYTFNRQFNSMVLKTDSKAHF